MLRNLLTWRTLAILGCVGLIVAGLARMIEVRAPDRPVGSWSEARDRLANGEPNVVFVLIDTLRADRLSAYGYERETSPILDAVAASGVRFADVRAESTWTKTSMASIWSATHPSTHHVTRWPHGLPEALRTPAEILRDAGYHTVGIWRNGWVAPNFGFGQGFDVYLRPLRRQEPERLQSNPSAYQLPGTDHDLTMAAAEFLRRAGDEKFFLYLHYMDVHQYVYDESADFGTRYSDIYDNSIHWVDANLGSLVATLQQEELMRNTILVIASDHGEAFGEHGREGHARDLYRETTTVPLVMALPRRLEEGIVVETPVRNVDLWPTLLDLLDLPPLAHAAGLSLVPLIEAAAGGGEPPPESARPRLAFLDQTWGRRETEPDPLFAIDHQGYRLFHKPNPGAAELYDLRTDPQEQRNLARRRPEVVARLRATLEELVAGAEPPWGDPVQVPVSDMDLGQLRALGYALPSEKGPRSAPEAAGEPAPATE